MMIHNILIGILFSVILQAEEIDLILEKIYQRVLLQEMQLKYLGDYSHVQKVLFSKFDGDGELEEQSRREFEVKLRPNKKHHRKLISAYEYENGQWIDITAKEAGKQLKPYTRSEEFSLTEIVGPEARKDYVLRIIGEESVRGVSALNIYAEPREEDEKKFKGNLWVDQADYSLILAELRPSAYPMGVDDMVMRFEMEKFGAVWLPYKINFKAEISFLFIFRGSIRSEILFENYEFNQSFPDSLFSQ